ncbi:MAG: adenosylmethionine--8-amino-7-oxononanoate transaminase [Elusimicrobiota bacterium]
MIRRSRQLIQWDKKYLWHPFTQHYAWDKSNPLIIESGKGVYLKDINGQKYLDGVSSLWVNIHGHRHPVLDRAFQQQLKKIAHSTFLGLSHEPGILLAKQLADVAPKGLSRTFYSDNGATAVEVALKMAFQYWVEQPVRKKKAKTEFLAVKGSYHGDTIGAVSVGSIGQFHSKFKSLLFKTRFAMAPQCFGCPFNKTKVPSIFRCGEKINKIPKPGDKRLETNCRWECLKDVEGQLKKANGQVAAGILEPLIQGATGMRAMPQGYTAGFERLLRKYKALFIVDEVATGFGRTGTLFASEQENLTPDFLCVAKGLTGGLTPLAATLTTEKIFKTFYAPPLKMKTFFHGHSYTGHPLGSAVALANLKLIKNTKLLEKTRQKAHLLRKELKRLEDLHCVESIRQVGLMVGIELNPQKISVAQVCRRLLDRKIWLRPLGNVVVFMPPLVILDRDLIRVIKTLTTIIKNELYS